MPLSVFAQTMAELRRPLIRWLVGFAGMAWLIMLAHPLALLLNSGAQVVGPSFLFGSGMELSSQQNWLQYVGLELVLPVALAVFTIHLGSWLIAGEEERGSLGLLLSVPLSRTRLMLEKGVVLLLAVVASVAAVWLALRLTAWVGLLAVSGLYLERAAVGLFWLGLLFGALALALGALTGRRLLAQNAALGIAFLALLLNHLPQVLQILNWLRFFSPFYYYSNILTNQLFLAGMFVLAAVVILCFAASFLAFERRDLLV
jgi:ABC-2 type transport system permease protein